MSTKQFENIFVLVLSYLFQVARRTKESLVDIHLDPALHEACSIDVQRICHDTPPGQGRSNFVYFCENFSYLPTDLYFSCDVLDGWPPQDTGSDFE